MKSNSVFFNTLMLAAPVALWLQGSALAQNPGDANTPPPAQNAPDPALKSQQNVDFYFPGGTPSEFIAAVEKQYKVDWAKVADIPDNVANVHIPALRMNRQSAENILPPRGFRGGRAGAGRFGGGGAGGGGGFQADSQAERNPLDALVALYNSLWQAKPELGQLMVEGDLAKPSLVMFHSSAQPNFPSANADFKMKAFALNGIPENEWEKLEHVVADELDTLTWLQIERSRNVGEDPTPHEEAMMKLEKNRARQARVALYKDTGLLIVRGPESILDAAESLVTAWRAKHAPSKF
jgi:hypothetical protein